jgi:hypothetical protein
LAGCSRQTLASTLWSPQTVKFIIIITGLPTARKELQRRKEEQTRAKNASTAQHRGDYFQHVLKFFKPRRCRHAREHYRNTLLASSPCLRSQSIRQTSASPSTPTVTSRLFSEPESWSSAQPQSYNRSQIPSQTSNFRSPLPQMTENHVFEPPPSAGYMDVDPGNWLQMLETYCRESREEAGFWKTKLASDRKAQQGDVRHCPEQGMEGAR